MYKYLYIFIKSHYLSGKGNREDVNLLGTELIYHINKGV
jgi:hypothetical protein